MNIIVPYPIGAIPTVGRRLCGGGICIVTPKSANESGVAPVAINAIPIDYFINFETSTDGTNFTPAILSGCSVYRYPLLTWSTSSNGTTGMNISTSYERATPAPLAVSGVSYNDVGSTRGARTQCQIDANFAQGAFGGGPNAVTVGSWIKTVTTTSGIVFDYIHVNKAGGGFVVCQGSNNVMRIHFDGGLGTGGNITFTAGEWVYVSIRASQTGSSEMRIWNQDLGYLGASTGSSANNTAFNQLRFGRTDSHAGVLGSADIAYDDIAVDFTYAVPPQDIVSYNASNYPAATPALTANDSFAGSGPLTGWQNQVTGIVRASDQAQSNQTGQCMSFYTGESFAANQFSKATIRAWGNGQNMGVMVRATGEGAARGGYVYHTTSGSNRGIDRVVNNTATRLLNVSTTWTINDIMELHAYGPLLVLMKNGNIAASCFDYTITGGSPGLMLWRESWGTAATADNWQGGNIPS